MRDIPAARNTLRVLTYVASQGRPVRAATLSRELDIPRSTTYQLLRVMQDEGYLVHFPENRTYGLSRLVSEIGSAAMRAERIKLLARPLLLKVVRRVPQPVVGLLGVLRGTGVTYILKEPGPRAPTIITEIGVQLPAHLTATGRALLSHLSEEQLRALYPYPDDFYRRTDTGVQTFAELLGQLRSVEQAGWSIEDSEITDGLATVAAAAVDHNGYPTAALGVTFRSLLIDEQLVAEMGAAVAAGASELSLRLQGK